MQIDEFVSRIMEINSKAEADLAVDYEMFYSIKDYSLNFNQLKDILNKSNIDKTAFICGLIYLFPLTRVLINKIIEVFPETFSNINSERVIDIFSEILDGFVAITDKNILEDKLISLKQKLESINPEIIRLNNELKKIESDLRQKTEERNSLEERYREIKEKYESTLKVIDELLPETKRLQGQLQIIEENSLLHLKKDEIENRVKKIRKDIEELKKEYFPDDKALEELNKKLKG